MCNVHEFSSGVNAELAYIENGEVNNYSTKYAYRVDSHVGELKFTWNAPTNNKVRRRDSFFQREMEDREAFMEWKLCLSVSRMHLFIVFALTGQSNERTRFMKRRILHPDSLNENKFSVSRCLVYVWILPQWSNCIGWESMEWISLPLQIHYSIQLDSDPQVVAKLRHSPSGFLPRNPSEFSIEYRCAGTRSGQFEVWLLLIILWILMSQLESNWLIFVYQSFHQCTSESQWIPNGFYNTDSKILRSEIYIN